MEIEKPFKCIVCNAQFTNEDHLQVHKRRHEMSLNLNKSGSQQQQSLLESFVDETPTPTRFFRNCEEVGLFQDLQNVNPFDEQFAKAASATPSAGGEPFDFTSAISSSSVPPSASTSSTTASSISSSANNKRRYSDQDTLNTPQVFGYVVNSSSSTTNTCSTTSISSILTPMPPSSMTLEEGDSRKSADFMSTDRNSNQFNGTDSESTSSSSVETSHDAGVGKLPSMVGGKVLKSKTMLRLNLSPTLSVVLQESDSPESSKKEKPTQLLVPEKKAELLERNRAAASRSRERRKQWVSSLESKCQSLESMLAQTRAELSKQHTENQILRNELSRHTNCDVSREGEQRGEITILVHQTLPQPNILRQISQTAVISTISHTGESSRTQITSQVRVALPRTKAKRGRPRKGNERRVDPLSVLSDTASTVCQVPFKVQIQPVSRAPRDAPSHTIGL